ncbi:S41 family peptidase [Mangrovibacterium marinum]|uniref:Peptidase S41-like protein n=1 Tax=Mangrovibacterium marinum TaxID=1639118 RepID=A0A2T5C3B7_9BACT|nr:S41 family peptidase [Mangrovibacterium marinum]PTN09253.1 peptidase S41-like protein [Mangrovibacterium marinum]
MLSTSSFLSLLFLSVCIPFFSLGQDRTEAWQADLEQYQRQLETHHINLYNRIGKSDFSAELATIQQAVAHTTDWQIKLDLMRLTRKIGDGHTAVSLQNERLHYFPLGLRNISNGWRIVKTSVEYEDLLGKTLVAINGHPIDEVAAKLAPLVQFVENPYSVLFRIGDYLPISELLHNLHIIENPTKATFTVSDDSGTKTTRELAAINQSEYTTAAYFKELKIRIPELGPVIEWVDQKIAWAQVRDTKALYIDFSGYPDFEAMQKVGEQFYALIDQNQFRQLIIDLRGNTGGDLYVGLFLAYALNLADPIDWDHGVYLLTDQYTYSAAASNAALFRQLLNAKVVGMPTGSNPAGYQDLGEFTLDHSNVRITYSKRHFRLQQQENEALLPDVMIPHEWQAYKAGRDVMLEWILKDIRSQSSLEVK